MSLPKGLLSKFSNDITKTPFILFQSHPDDYHQITKQSENLAKTGCDNQSMLSKAFFHPKNVNLIQKQIIMQIFKQSDGEFLIENQDELDLLTVMESIFSQYAKHSPNQIKEQIKHLDNLVVDEVIPDIMSEVRAHLAYLNNVFGQRKIMDLPQNTSSAGSKNLPSQTNIWRS